MTYFLLQAQAAVPSLASENNVLKIAIGVIMLGLGLSLTVADFRRALETPRAVLVGLACQMLLLPAVCFLCAMVFGLPPALAVGLMLLSASPGGATANLYSHLSHGDVALNITLTAVNSVLSLFTLPLIVNLSLAYFLPEKPEMEMEFIDVVNVFATVLVPVGVGMTIRKFAESFARKMEKPVKILSALFLAVVVVAVIAKHHEILGKYIAAIGGAALAFNLISLATGYYVPLLFRLKKPQAIAIGMEIGIHNGTLAMLIAATVLGDFDMQIPAAVYSIIMFITAAGFGYLVNLKKES